jgi:hypothetical protein
MIKKYSYLLTLPAIAGLIFCTPGPAVYSVSGAQRIIDAGRAALCIPLKSMHVEYIDNTKSRAESQFTDSFLLEAANTFLLYETMRTFASARGAGPADTAARYSGPMASVLLHDTATLPEASKAIGELAARCSVDIVMLPYACTVRQQITQAKGWRGSSGPGYERPAAFSAATSVHVQLWSKTGRLIYERIGRSDTGKPILYSLLKKDVPAGDIVQFAKKMYAPPLIKSLYASVKKAMRFD